MIDASSFQFRLVIIYRIPYSAVHPITSSTFFLEFSDYLDSLLLSKVPLCISGDFNFHLDVSGDVDAPKFADLFFIYFFIYFILFATLITKNIGKEEEEEKKKRSGEET